ncbi:lipase family protein [Polynucleobacter sp. MWH-Braz-FAM2G]|uniref:lipase family protein n=1 Tax=Polynucleobacter sp. MWH-Braz-FAM2G TaxID=1855883 RepID=UPI001BFE722D|nr:lipase family protein [Polynucleobacter sp. MWH-Braz-FAM2G]QWD89918.1 lipase [Polynucleobacter sp. MWH-Braz-FAM2G]
MKRFSRVVLLWAFCMVSTAVFADPPMQPWYQSVMKMKPEGKLGQIIKQEKVATSVKGAQAWRVAYISSDVSGRKTISTGLIVAPTGSAPAGGRPIVTWAHGTTGTAQNCGPSQVIDPVVPINEYFLIGGNSWTDYGVPALQEFINEGYVVAATDYQGLGGGGIHQYANGVSNAMDTINAARAAGSIKQTAANKKTVFIGWSQGGLAAFAGAGLADYMQQTGTAFDNLDMLGFIAMGPAYFGTSSGKLDQAAADKYITDSLKSYVHNIFDFAHASMFFYSLPAAFPDLKLTDVFTDEGVKVLSEIYANKCMHVASDTMNYNIGSSYNSLLKPQFTNTMAWAQALLKTSPAYEKLIAPVQIYYGVADNVNNPAMGKFFQDQMCKRGANVGRLQLPGEKTGHFNEPPVSQQFFLPWIKDRFAGKPLPNACPQS